MWAALGVALAPRSDPPVLHTERILVDLFENQTGEAELDYLGAATTNHVTAGLTFTTFADVVTRGAPLLTRRTEPIAADEDAVRAARERGAGTLVTGTYMLRGDSIHFDALLVDVQGGSIVAAIQPVATSRGNATGALEDLRDRVMVAVGAHVDPRLATRSMRLILSFSPHPRPLLAPGIAR